MPKQESYYVVSNPLPSGESALTVLFAGESQTKPVHRLGPKVYDYYLIHYVISGRGVFSTQGEEYALGAGDSFVIEPEQLISYVSGRNRYRCNPFTRWRHQRIQYSLCKKNSNRFSRNYS